ncbi:peptide ABC transporter permease, partial [Pseudomonas syringae]
MGAVLRRLRRIIPTLLCRLRVNFFVVQAGAGGPVAQAIARLQGSGGATVGAGASESAGAGHSKASRGLDPALIKQVERQYGFDKPLHERLWLMLKNYARLDVGSSFVRGATVTDRILQRVPGSIALCLWASLLTYA